MLSIEQKAAVWEKPDSQLNEEERLYAEDPISYDMAQNGEFDLEKIGRLQHQSAWVDVQRKAKRLLDSNQVVLKHKRPYDLEVPQGFVEVSGNIEGDHARYDAKIIYSHPRSGAVRTWACQCTWARWAWNRSPQYKKFEGRLCSHVLALHWRAFNLPVEYEEVRPEVLKYHLPEMLQQDRLFNVDEITLAEKIVQKQPRISPGLFESIYGIDLGILNKSIQQAFDLAPADQVIEDLKNKMFSLIDQIDEISRENFETIRDSIFLEIEKRNVYDTDESVSYKKEIVNKLTEVSQYHLRMKEIDSRLRAIRATRTRQIDEVEKNKREYEELTAEKEQMLKNEPRIQTMLNDIRYAPTVLQEIYDNNIAAEKQPRTKAEDVLNYFQWYEQHAPEIGKRYADEIRRQQTPIFEIIEQMRQEMIYAQAQMELPEVAIPGVRVRVPKRQEIEETEDKPPLPIPGQMRMQTSFSVLSSDVPIKDIVFYIQNELALGNRPNAYTRREAWGEQRGGLFPHPDAQPIMVRNDGTFVYSPDDLGYDPETGMMGCQKEERGTYAGIPIGSSVQIVSVDPRDRMAKIEFILEGDPPNHSHIHLWLPLKDIDLV